MSSSACVVRAAVNARGYNLRLPQNFFSGFVSSVISAVKF
jgi:hypothetical protein